ncbi:growth-regulating factor 4-like isoform X2 [Andrographis paniculata]|uniref:growth-regulating factor 4-like isoform X2 n=1 Tax=Andrographis paniculata TaxID=175694 RepID=UPI0021E8FEDD|nr:growth-regulating factor 4-like isoform X2 [Andrographis paniculata]
MSGTASTSVAVGVGIGGGGEVGYGEYIRPPFTAVQWQELEHQAMIYKYLVAGLPVPPDLIMPIRRSFDALSARFFHHPSLGYCSYYGKKFDPEPGRCRRTDGKKWRCSKDAHPDSKYCERHMHRGRNRSRKPVESQSNTQSLSSATSHVSSGCSSVNIGNLQGSGSASGYQNMPLYSVVSSDGSPYASNATKLQMEPNSYAICSKEFSFSPEPSSSVGNLGLGSSAGSSMWRFAQPHVSLSNMPRQKPDSQLMDPSQQNVPLAFEPISGTASKHHHHCFLEGGGIKQDSHPVHPFFSEWPTTKEPWPTLDNDDGSSKNVFSSTQLSISIPRVASSDFSSRSAYSPKDA